MPEPHVATTSVQPAQPRGESGTVPDRRTGGPLLGISVAQLVGWQLLVVCVLTALIRHDPLRWICYGLAFLILLSTAARIRHRWLYQWIPTLFGFWRGRPARQTGDEATEFTLLRRFAPALEVVGSSRAAASVGMVYDGQAWASIVAVRLDDVVGRMPGDLPLDGLAGLIDAGGAGLVSVQVVLHQMPSTATGADLAPVAQQAWIALRVDPSARRVSAFVRSDTVTDVHKALSRSANRVAELLASSGLRCQILGDDGVREALTRCQAEPSPGPSAAETWASLRGGHTHTTYRLRRWPTGGLPAVRHAVNHLDASFVTLTVGLSSAADTDRVAVSVLVRTTGPMDAQAQLRPSEVLRTTAAQGVSLVLLYGEQADGLLATVPLGRCGPSRSVRSAWQVLQIDKATSLDLPLGSAGLLVGRSADGAPTRAQLLRARPTHIGLFGSMYVAQLLALRTAEAGIAVHVVTGRPGLWQTTAAAANRGTRRIGLYPPGGGLQQADDGRPVLVIDDAEGMPGPLLQRNIGAWQSVVVVRSRVGAENAHLLRSYDLVVLQRMSDRTDTALERMVPEQAARWIGQMPADVVGLYAAGEITFTGLGITQAELAVLGPPRTAERMGASAPV